MTRLDLIRSLPAGTTGAEIGSYRGDFAAEILSTQVNRLYIVDCWRHQQGSYERDPSNVDDGGHQTNERYVRDRFKHDHRAIIIRGFSDSVCANLRSKGVTMDWVYIDADHCYRSVIQDLILWSALARQIFLHDFVDNERTREMGFGVVAAVNKFCADTKWKIKRVTDEEYPTCELELKP